MVVRQELPRSTAGHMNMNTCQVIYNIKGAGVVLACKPVLCTVRSNMQQGVSLGVVSRRLHACVSAGFLHVSKYVSVLRLQQQLLRCQPTANRCSCCRSGSLQSPQQGNLPCVKHCVDSGQMIQGHCGRIVFTCRVFALEIHA